MQSSRIILLKGDITELDCDAIVNAANTELWLGSGVAGAILKKGGKSIEDEAVKLGPVALGDAVITKGGNLRATHVIHAAAMRPGEQASTDSITKATHNALTIAADRMLKSIAFPALGTGAGGVTYHRCARAMLSETMNFITENDDPKHVYFVLYGDEAFSAFQNAYESMKE